MLGQPHFLARGLHALILIDCNNNFEGDEVDFASKVARPRDLVKDRIATQMARQEKPKMMALNIPTYVNLYGYGYHNVFELDELLDVKDRGWCSRARSAPLRPRSRGSPDALTRH